MKKNKISKNWVNKQRRDIYVRQSKVDGYRARSAYKLIEIDEKFKIFKGGEIFGSEQLAMNMSVYVDNVETEFLPLNCNWITSNLLPKFDEDKDTWVEPYLPNYKIGIMHLAAGIWKDKEDMRLNKSIKIDIQTLTGKILNKSLRFNN